MPLFGSSQKTEDNRGLADSNTVGGGRHHVLPTGQAGVNEYPAAQVPGAGMGTNAFGQTQPTSGRGANYNNDNTQTGLGQHGQGQHGQHGLGQHGQGQHGQGQLGQGQLGQTQLGQGQHGQGQHGTANPFGNDDRHTAGAGGHLGGGHGIQSTGATGQHGTSQPSSGGGAGARITGKIESAIGSMVGSDALKAKGLQKENEANQAKLQSHEIGEAERLEREAMQRRERAVAHGAPPGNAGLGAGNPGVGSGQGRQF